jgi:hypothetical protein
MQQEAGSGNPLPASLCPEKIIRTRFETAELASGRVPLSHL